MNRPCVLIFAASDPGGETGLQADIQTVAGLDAHPLSVITALAVQEGEQLVTIHPMPAALVTHQANALIANIEVAAVKIGLVGNRANALAIADLLQLMRLRQPELPIVLDPLLTSRSAAAPSLDDPVRAIQPLLSLANLVTPDVQEAEALSGGGRTAVTQAEVLLRQCMNVVIKGGEGDKGDIVNRWFTRNNRCAWTWPRAEASISNSNASLATAITALLARGKQMVDAIEEAQAYCHQTLLSAYTIANGHRIPNRSVSLEENT